MVIGMYFNFHGKMITGFANAESYSFGGKQYYDGGAYYYGAMAEDAIILVGRCLKEIGTILTIILRQLVVGK